jgi:hypothetical protein
VQDEPELSNVQRAILAAQNSGLDFSSIPTKVNGGEVIEILDDDEEEAINEYIKEEVQVMVELNYVEEKEEARGMEESEEDGDLEGREGQESQTDSSRITSCT